MSARIDELTRLGLVDVRSAPVVPACYGWPTCAVCGCVTPADGAARGLGPGELLCPDCASHLKGWAARHIMRAALARDAEAKRKSAERMELANSCTCGEDLGLRIDGVPLCDSCLGWAAQLGALNDAERARLGR